MFNQPTVIVLGAGASKEVEMPLGNELKWNIRENLSFHDVQHKSTSKLKFKEDKYSSFLTEVTQIEKQELHLKENSLYNSFYTHIIKESDNYKDDDLYKLISYIFPKHEVNKLQDDQIYPLGQEIYPELARRISRAVPYSTSIDTFIENHKEDKYLTKLSKLRIGVSILKGEQKANLMPASRNSKEPYKDIWLELLFQKLYKGVEKKDLHSIFNNITIINFNYDRCVEEYFYQCLFDYYFISRAEAAEVMKTLTIYHPYGVIAPLDWQDPENGVAFGGKYRDAEHLIRSALALKTFSESVDESKELEAMREALKNAEKSIWLGYAFHEQNMDLIAPARAPLSDRQQELFATACGISEPNRIAIERDIKKRLNLTACEIKDMTCTQLFTDYERRF